MFKYIVILCFMTIFLYQSINGLLRYLEKNTSYHVVMTVSIIDNIPKTRDETHHPPLLTRLGSTGLVKKANVVGENELVNEYLLCKLCREYIIFHDKTQ